MYNTFRFQTFAYEQLVHSQILFLQLITKYHFQAPVITGLPATHPDTIRSHFDTQTFLYMFTAADYQTVNCSTTNTKFLVEPFSPPSGKLPYLP